MSTPNCCTQFTFTTLHIGFMSSGRLRDESCPNEWWRRLIFWNPVRMKTNWKRSWDLLILILCRKPWVARIQYPLMNGQQLDKRKKRKRYGWLEAEVGVEHKAKIIFILCVQVSSNSPYGYDWGSLQVDSSERDVIEWIKQMLVLVEWKIPIAISCSVPVSLCQTFFRFFCFCSCNKLAFDCSCSYEQAHPNAVNVVQGTLSYLHDGSSLLHLSRSHQKCREWGGERRIILSSIQRHSFCPSGRSCDAHPA